MGPAKRDDVIFLILLSSILLSRTLVSGRNKWEVQPSWKTALCYLGGFYITAACWSHNNLSAVPKVELISLTELIRACTQVLVPNGVPVSGAVVVRMPTWPITGTQIFLFCSNSVTGLRTLRTEASRKRGDPEASQR